MRDKIKIFIVDDHPVVCEGITQMINQESDLEVCGCAPDAVVAMKMIQSLKPDMVITDISIIGKSGIELIADIKTRYPEVKIIVLTMHAEPGYVDRTFKAGAKGYVTKQDATETIIKAIRKINSGGIYVSEIMTSRIMENMYDRDGRHIHNQMAIDNLSQREFEVMRLIGQGMKIKDIAEVLNVSPKTVNAHRENIKRKLNLNNVQELLKYAIQSKQIS